MYLLDTNVVSELRKFRVGKGDLQVAAWARKVPEASLFVSAIVVYELEIGVLRAEHRDPAQGSILREWLDQHVLPRFNGRNLPVDAAVARRSAALQVPHSRPYRDTLIAATALVHSLTVVTRNVADFESTGVRWLNPWEPNKKSS
jgi:toxin FitB